MQYLPLVTTFISACINHQPDLAGNCSSVEAINKAPVITRSRPAPSQWYADHVLYKTQQNRSIKKLR